MNAPHLPSQTELDALWRGDPEFIGPVAPPMLLWFFRGRPRDQWEIDAERRREAERPRGVQLELAL